MPRRIPTGNPPGRPTVWQNPADKQLVLRVPAVVYEAWKDKRFSDVKKVELEEAAIKHVEKTKPKRVD